MFVGYGAKCNCDPFGDSGLDFVKIMDVLFKRFSL